MNEKELINRRDAIKEGFRVRVDKEGDHLSVETEGDDSQELFDFAKCLFGNNFDSFNHIRAIGRESIVDIVVLSLKIFDLMSHSISSDEEP